MQIAKLAILGLFGLFNHHVPFRTKDRITIIHGPNGVGKTTVLKLLLAVFSKRFNVLHQTPFERMEIHFSDDRVLSIVRVPASESSPMMLRFEFTNEVEPYLYDRSREASKHHRRFSASLVERHVPSLSYIGGVRWLDANDGAKLTMEDVYERYGDVLPGGFPSARTPDWLSDLLSSVAMHFIQTQRLLATGNPSHQSIAARSDSRPRATVEDLAKDMAARMQEVLRQSGTLAASLDRSFPYRLLQGESPPNATEESIRHRYESQSAYRQRLMTAGLLEAEEALPLQQDQLDPSERKVLWYYLDDIDKKLDVYRDLLERIELFTSIINDNKFLFKSLSLHKDKGFIFTSKNGQIVPLEQLSSGEQHELVLAYELLFLAKRKSLILVDEPELSLHVTWQHKFLDDMQRISQLSDLDFLIATHSPSIVYRRRDLMVKLGEAKV